MTATDQAEEDAVKLPDDRDELSYMLTSCAEDVFEALDINLSDYLVMRNQVRGVCPVHESNNESAFTYYFDRGLWFCWTNHCHNKKGSDLVGLVALRSRKSIKWACRWAQKFLANRNITDEETATRIRASITSRQQDVDHWNLHVSQRSFDDSVLDRLDHADSYFEKRGLDPGVGREMKAGLVAHGKWRGRLVFPVRNVNKQLVGFTGRTVIKQQPKWLHSKFKTGINLFNIDRAFPWIRKTQTVVLTEGPFDVVKLDMAGYPFSVGVFGHTMSEGQSEILTKCGVVYVVVAFDPDRIDSHEVRTTVTRLQQQDFDVHVLRWQGDEDLGDMKLSKVNKVMGQLEFVRRCT